MPDVTGPFGALLLAVFLLGIAGKVIAELWGEHKRHDHDVEAQRSEAVAGWRDQAEVSERGVALSEQLLTELQSFRKDQATRRRRSDPRC